MSLPGMKSCPNKQIPVLRRCRSVLMQNSQQSLSAHWGRVEREMDPCATEATFTTVALSGPDAQQSG